MKRELQVGDRVAFDTHWSGTVSSTKDAVGAFMDSPHDVRTIRGVVTAIKGRAAQVESRGRYYAKPIRNLRRLIRRERRRWEGEWHCNYMPDGSVRVLFSPDANAQDGLPENGERMTLLEARPRKAGRG